MKTKITILLYAKSSRSLKNGLTPIYLRITVDGVRIEINTSKYVDKTKWSAEAAKLKSNSEEARAINSYLDILKSKVFETERDMVNRNITITSETFKNKYLGIEEKKLMLIPIFKDHNERMKYLTSTEHKFSVKPCRDISFEFIQDGYSIIHKYSKGRLYESDPKIYCFDDLGLENNLKYYGNECNVMAEILLSRYDIFISKKNPTHITTNLSASEIETNYGNRVRSRMREMFNLIAYDKTTKDKR